MMLSCREVTRLVSEGMDRPLGWGERLRLRLHLAICRGCSAFGRHVQVLRKAVRRRGEP